MGNPCQPRFPVKLLSVGSMKGFVGLKDAWQGSCDFIYLFRGFRERRL